MPIEPGRAANESGLDAQLGTLRQRESSSSMDERLAALEARLREPRGSVIQPRTVAIIGSLIAALVPLTTAIDGYVRWRADLAVAEQQQQHVARMDALKTALSAELPELERESRLRLLVAMLAPSDVIRQWASGELTRVEKTVARLESEQAAALSDAERWSQKAAAAAAAIEGAGGSVPRGSSAMPAASSDPAEPPAGANLGEATPALPRRQPERAPAALKITPGQVAARQEYLTAKRLSEAAALKADVTAQRLSGSNSLDARALRALRPAE